MNFCVAGIYHKRCECDKAIKTRCSPSETDRDRETRGHHTEDVACGIFMAASGFGAASLLVRKMPGLVEKRVGGSVFDYEVRRVV